MVFWIFGYGSLMWNPGFEYDEKILGYIKAYKRVFDLGKALTLQDQCSCILYLLSLLMWMSDIAKYIDIDPLIFRIQLALITEAPLTVLREHAR